ncbi:hypothetical protein T492DRAFT_1087691 [Pavlovales sp. CCMP2436]|nr:hypothetical protein T492DRAFT_1087691 [Pavlovales sp. CCMP2436]|mmetsp:Transcript_31665/g.79117  ORF Transcript_31665/g.79117 Transcript_31665/m.79117 type:complete len:222 (-) Transcript_31665:56-721(-)
MPTMSRSTGWRYATLLAICACVELAGAINVKWTPNGEAPLPFSQKARDAMGEGAAAAAAAPLSQTQMVLAEVASFGGLLAFLILVNLGEPFLLNNWIKPAALAKLTARARGLFASLQQMGSGGSGDAKPASSKVAMSKVAASPSSGGSAAKTAAAARKARMARMAVSKAKAAAAEPEPEEEAAVEAEEEVEEVEELEEVEEAEEVESEIAAEEEDAEEEEE